MSALEAICAAMLVRGFSVDERKRQLPRTTCLWLVCRCDWALTAMLQLVCAELVSPPHVRMTRWSCVLVLPQVYISMPKEEKTDAKATVDLLGSYFGKSGASWIVQGLVLSLGSLTAALPLLAAVHVAMCVAWTRATWVLGGIMAQVREQLCGGRAGCAGLRGVQTARG
jgi:hypothetical protein